MVGPALPLTLTKFILFLSTFVKIRVVESKTSKIPFRNFMIIGEESFM